MNIFSNIIRLRTHPEKSIVLNIFMSFSVLLFFLSALIINHLILIANEFGYRQILLIDYLSTFLYNVETN